MGDKTILVTNDDGLDSPGLQILARALTPLGRVVIVAPDREFSGAGAAIGPLHISDPTVSKRHVDGVDEAWAVDGPPGLCVFYARLGAFDFHPDIIVSGINPGANVARAVYHSGTIGAVLTGRLGDIPGVAVSQSFAAPLDDTDEARTDYDERVSRQLWEPAAQIGVAVAGGLLDAVDAGQLSDVAVVNLNVPNLAIDQIKGWRWTEVGRTPNFSMTKAALVPRSEGPEGTYRIETSWGQQTDQSPDSDSAALNDDAISISLLSRIEAVPHQPPALGRALDDLLA